MEHRRQPVAAGHLGQLVRRLHELRPLRVAELGRREPLAGEDVRVEVVDEDQVAAVHAADELARGLDVVARRRPTVAVLEREHRERAGHLELPPRELRAELLGVRREIAVGAELDPAVAGGRDLVEETAPRSLVRIVRKPDAPRVGCAPENDPHRQP
jgi:hypothetical protein